MLDTHNISRTVIDHFLNRFEDSSAKSQKVSFYSKFIVFLLSECYKIFNITAKKVLLKITLNSIQIALEKFLYHFVRYCGYLTCCLGCKEYLACNFESMTPTKRNLGNKSRTGSSFSQLRLILYNLFNTTKFHLEWVSIVKNYYLWAFCSLKFFLLVS